MINPDELQERLETMAREAGEHFDAVLVLGTVSENGESYAVRAGSGNHYARVGLARWFLTCDEALTIEQETGNQIVIEDDDDESDSAST